MPESTDALDDDYGYGEYAWSDPKFKRDKVSGAVFGIKKCGFSIDESIDDIIRNHEKEAPIPRDEFKQLVEEALKEN